MPGFFLLGLGPAEEEHHDGAAGVVDQLHQAQQLQLAHPALDRPAGGRPRVATCRRLGSPGAHLHLGAEGDVLGIASSAQQTNQEGHQAVPAVSTCGNASSGKGFGDHAKGVAIEGSDHGRAAPSDLDAEGG